MTGIAVEIRVILEYKSYGIFARVEFYFRKYRVAPYRKIVIRRRFVFPASKLGVGIYRIL